ncbi:LysR substrate-binding domain-containing protein [Klebsiella sp. 141198]|uniref:LysR substrate-binding domain-containing protein n=1 Tax=Klebsiella sp. 141198 TaxID=3020036 RepID=UPI003D35766D
MVINDLLHHECISFSLPNKGDIYRWEFTENHGKVKFDPAGKITVNDGELMRDLAVREAGHIYSSTFHSSRELENGTLEVALFDSPPEEDGLISIFHKVQKTNQNYVHSSMCI